MHIVHILKKAKEYINYKIRIERINDKLLSNIDTKYIKYILQEVEEILFNQLNLCKLYYNNTRKK